MGAAVTSQESSKTSCSQASARCYLGEPRHRQGPQRAHASPLPPSSMQDFPDKVRKLIKKQYLCQCKTFAKRLNPHSWSCAAAPSAVLDATPSYPVPPEQTPSWVGWTSLGLPHSGIPSTLQRRDLGRVCADLGGGQCRQLCLPGCRVPVGPHSELLRALLGGVKGHQAGQGSDGHTETGVGQASRIANPGRAWGGTSDMVGRGGSYSKRE